MSKALVRARGIATPEQFKTDWSQFMKQNIAMNIMIYPHGFVLDKSEETLSVKCAIPKVMKDKAQSSDPVYVGFCFKNDKNEWESFVSALTMNDFSVALDVGGNEFMEQATAIDMGVDVANLTTGNVYDVHLLSSNKEIAVETAESSRDMPYVLFGPASEAIFEVTAKA